MLGGCGQCRFARPWLSVGLATALLWAGPARSQAAAPPPAIAAPTIGVNLNLTPRRVTLDRATRTATVFVFNQGDTATSFDIALVDRVMLPNGQIQAVDQASATSSGKAIVDLLHSAHEMVIVTPRRITLAPGKGQTIRLRAAPPNPGATAATEYRTHLTVTNIPPPDAGLTADQAAAVQSGQMLFRVRSAVAISIPVIVRTAPIDARARLDEPRLSDADARLEPGGPQRKVPAVTFDIVRLGPSSLFGNVEIRAGTKGEETLGLARGVGVYPEIERRSLQVMLKRRPRPGEKLTITFTDDDGHPGTVLARTSLEAP